MTELKAQLRKALSKYRAQTIQDEELKELLMALLAQFPAEKGLQPGWNLFGNCPMIMWFDSTRFARYGTEIYNTVVLPVGRK